MKILRHHLITTNHRMFVTCAWHKSVSLSHPSSAGGCAIMAAKWAISAELARERSQLMLCDRPSLRPYPWRREYVKEKGCA